MASKTTQPLTITDGSTVIELEHTIGLNTSCHNPCYYLTKLDKENEQKQGIADDDNTAPDYLLVCGSSIVLSSFINPHCQSFLRGHTSLIESCVVSPNRSLIASSQRGPSTPDVYIWNVNSNKLLYKLEQHKKGVNRMAFSDCSRFLATIGSVEDNRMFIWDMNSGYIVTSSVINPCPCLDIVWGGRVKDVKKRLTTDYLFATCGAEQVRIWAMTPSNGNLISEKCKTSNLHSVRTFTCLSFSDTADLLVAGTSSGDYFIFDVRKLTALCSYQSNCIGGINTIMTTKLISNNDGSNIYIHDPLSAHYFIRIIIGCGDGSISIWEYNDDLERFIEENKLNINDGGIECMDINNDKNKVLVATTKGNIHEIDIESNRNENKNENKRKIISYNETSSIIDVKFPSNVSDSFLTVSEFGSIRKWSMNDYSILLQHDGITNGTLSFDFNDEVIMTGCKDGNIRAYNSNKSNDGMLWDIKNAHSCHGGVSSLRIGYNQKYIISAGNDGTLRCWDIRFKSLVANLKEHTSTINSIELYSDSRHVLTCSKDRSFICWDFVTQKRISCHRQNMGTINDIKLNKTEDIVITCGGDRCIRFWDIRQSKPINSIQNVSNNVDINCIQLSSNGDLLASADSSSILKLWDLKTFKLITMQNGFCGKINGIAFSNDDKQIVSVAQDSSIMIWNIFTM